jgi:hypothetical protein
MLPSRWFATIGDARRRLPHLSAGSLKRGNADTSRTVEGRRYREGLGPPVVLRSGPRDRHDAAAVGITRLVMQLQPPRGRFPSGFGLSVASMRLQCRLSGSAWKGVRTTP